MVFYINNGLCCSDMPLPNMVLRNDVKYVLMEYRNQVETGRFFIERDGLQDFYDELDDENFIKAENLPVTYMESIHNLKKEIVVMMALLD